MDIATTKLCLFVIHVLMQPHFSAAQCSGTPKSIEVGYKPDFIKFPQSGEYGTNLQCEWHLKSTVSGTILYKSTGIDIDCSDSYSIYDGSSLSSPAKETGICTTGSSMNKPLDRSSGQDLFLRFVSDGTATSGQDNGFTIHFVSAPDLSSCSVSGSSTTLVASNTEEAITSPLFPNIYPSNHQCTWLIMPSTPGATITLSLFYIDIDTSGSTCYDKLIINYDSQTDEICGDENFSPNKTYTNGGNGDINVTFSSDFLQQESGFVAVFVEKGNTSWTCDPQSGGLHKQCLKTSTFDDYQHAYCIRSDEVLTRTYNTVRCADQCRTYCLLTCMTEEDGVFAGQVADKCRCYPTETTDPTTQLPSWCMNPQGQCEFYDDCITASYMLCENITEMLSALKNQCEWLSDGMFNYSACETKAWIRDVRLCFQTSLMAKLSNNSVSCSELTTTLHQEIYDSCLNYRTSGGVEFCGLSTEFRQAFNEELIPFITDDDVQAQLNKTVVKFQTC